MNTLPLSIEWLPAPDDYPKGVLFVSKCKLYVGVTYEFLDELQRLRDENKRLREENLKLIQEFTNTIDKAKREYYTTIQSLVEDSDSDDDDDPYDEYDIEHEGDLDFT
jgi:hypothetical protein